MIEPKRKLLLWPMSQSAAPTVVACAGINGTACPPCERAMARNETLRPARAPPDDEWADREHSPELRAGPSSRLRVRPPAQDAPSRESTRGRVASNATAAAATAAGSVVDRPLDRPVRRHSESPIPAAHSDQSSRARAPLCAADPPAAHPLQYCATSTVKRTPRSETSTPLEESIKMRSWDMMLS